MHPLPSWIEPRGDGTYAIDTGFHRTRYDAAWLIVDGGRAAFIDTGTAFALPRLLGALDALGVPRGHVDWVVPTHVHLDHAGGVGQLMDALPAARLLVHPRGLRHMVDPSALWAGALQVYGPEAMARDYGALQPVPGDRAHASEDGGAFQVGGRTLRVAHTDGHAKHHHCLHDEAHGAWFTGDAFGMAPIEFRVDGRAFMVPTTTPVQFEPEAMHATIDRLLATAPRRLHVTHYATIDDPAEAGLRLHVAIDESVRRARAQAAAPDRTRVLARSLLEQYVDGAMAHGVTMSRAEAEDLLRDDAALNAAGLEVWLDREARGRAS